MGNLPDSVDVDQLVLNIRQRVREQAGRLVQSQGGIGVEAAERFSQAEHVSLAGVQAALARFEASAARTGHPTPEPPTWRGRIGAFGMRLLGRLLWWYSHQLERIWTSLVLLHREEHNALTGIQRAADADRSGISRSLRAMEERVQTTQSGLARLEGCYAEIRQARLEIAATRASLDELAASVAGLRKETAAAINAEAAARQSALAADGALIRELQREFECRESEAASARDTRDTVDRLASGIAEIRNETRAAQAAIHPQSAAIAKLQADMEAERAQLVVALARTQRISSEIAALGLLAHRNRTEMCLQDRRISIFIEEARTRLPEKFTGEQIVRLSTVDEHQYDSLYSAFQDAFRGSRAEIKLRQAEYLPLLREHHIGTGAMPVLDLGCGRGEWLELLCDENLVGRGVDRNEQMVENCRAAGFDVQTADALGYLRSLPADSLGAVTAFHLVEHLPFDIVLGIVDESLRVLRAGGVLILETPNPQNLLVGACNFHFDPTHLRPLPSPMLRFFVEARGFCRVEIRNLHPYETAVRFPDEGDLIAARLNDFLYGPQDYAVIGVRA
jgi:SAM-dependent methyltransferase